MHRKAIKELRELKWPWKKSKIENGMEVPSYGKICHFKPMDHSIDI